MNFYHTPHHEMSRLEWVRAIVEALQKVSDTWVLREIYRAIINITKGGAA